VIVFLKWFMKCIFFMCVLLMATRFEIISPRSAIFTGIAATALFFLRRQAVRHAAQSLERMFSSTEGLLFTPPGYSPAAFFIVRLPHCESSRAPEVNVHAARKFPLNSRTDAHP
jgi:hypothetical protein